MRILILNGPNLNLLGQREPDFYGTQTLGDLENQMRKFGQSQGLEIECYQSNHEGHLIDALHRARNRVCGVVFNPGGYCHTSVALRDAIASIKIPVIEVHISNIHNREDFRSRSLTAGVCAGQISGLGLLSYEMGVVALVRILKVQQPVLVEPARPAERVPEARDERHDEKAREDKARDDKARDDKARDDKARDDKARDDKARDEKAREDKAREEREERESKRRRRGRRGGRGRRRGEPEEVTKEEREAAEAAESEPNIAERYANLKGVVVRRGLDVLAEMEEEGEEEPVLQQPMGLVTFHEMAADQIEAYAASGDEQDEAPLAVMPGRVSKPAPKPVIAAREEAPQAKPEAEAKAKPEPVIETQPEIQPEPVIESQPETEPAVEPAVLDVVATQQADEVAAEPTEPVVAEAEAAAEGEGEAEAEGEATEEGEAPKKGRGSRGGRRRKAPAGGRRRTPAPKKTEE